MKLRRTDVFVRAFRLMASVPPVICGILVRELGTITDYAGTGGFLIGLCFPALLYMSSRKKAEEKHFDLDTFYTSYGSSTKYRQIHFLVWYFYDDWCVHYIDLPLKC